MTTREQKLADALKRIATTSHRIYDGDRIYISDHDSGYALGIADGHRLAAKWAEEALASQAATEEVHDKISQRKVEEDGRKEAAKIPVDRTAQVLTDGSPVTPDHRDLKDNGQQKGYVVLSAAERAKGFVRPVRASYVHEKCGTLTSMGRALAETYARDPYFYSGTFCCSCSKHFPVGEDGEFVWAGTTEKVGT